MRKLITYFDPRVIENNPEGDTVSIIVDNDNEYEINMTAIIDPERGITKIAEHDIVGDISIHNINANTIRKWRDEEFKLIDKYQLPLLYVSLTPEQQSELSEYRQAWLDAPETLVIPVAPEWISGTKAEDKQQGN